MTELFAPVTGDAPADLAAILLPQQPISDLLQKILDVAVATVEAVGAASVTLTSSEPPGYRTVSASGPSARTLDEIQYCAHDGPCVAAVARSEEVTVWLPSPEWETLSAAALATGYRSLRSVPLALEGQTAGALNLYSSEPNPWDGATARAVRLIGGQTEVVLLNAMSLARAEYANMTLRRALETRTVIGQAQGVLMARQHIDAVEAFDILRRASQRTNRKLRDIATDIVASALGNPADPSC